VSDDLLKSGLASLSVWRKEHRGRIVTYSRGEDEVEITATVDRSRFPIVTEEGQEIDFMVRDYIVDVADLVLGDETVTPAEGDKIADEDADEKACIYEVMAPGTGEPAWRWTDGYRRAFRIHTKLVSET